MRNRFIALAVEAAVLDLTAVFIIWNAYISPQMGGSSGQEAGELTKTGPIIIAAALIAVAVIVALQGYFLIVKPYLARIEKMERAVEESEKAEAIRREFVANVSHELKTPLTSISGFIETLQDGAAEDPEIRTKFIDIIAIETARLKRLIGDLLVLSDIESKQMQEGSAFNAGEEIECTIEALQPIAEEKKIDIITDLDADISINGSADRFRQMMMNLIENAVKYSDENSRIWVKVYREGERIIVSVKDEGIGIAPEHHDRLFERFYRVDKSRSKKAGGTGLGLSIVKHIAVLFGASLKVESSVGKGSEFFVIF